VKTKLDPKTSFPKIVGKEIVKNITNVVYHRLTRVGGWGVAGGRKTGLNALKKGIHEITR